MTSGYSFAMLGGFTAIVGCLAGLRGYQEIGFQSYRVAISLVNF